MPLALNDNRHLLSMAFGEAIFKFTQKRPMKIEHILEALCFTAGHALAQKAARKFHETKELRAMCIQALDRGLAEGSRSGETPQIILPSDTGVKFD
jgi:hypothetical protein